MKNDANKGSVTSPRAWQIFSLLVLPPIVGWLGLALFINRIKPGLGPVKAEPRTLVVQLLRSESQLITALLTTEQIIDLERDQKVFGDWVIGKTKLLYIAHGKVKAGIDLSKFSKDNVVVKSDQIFIKMPAPKVLDANLDVEESKVYDIDKDGFFPPDVAVELQEQAESIAIDQIIQSACKNNILAHANFQAESIVSNLLAIAGLPNVTVETTTPNTEKCIAEATQEPLANFSLEPDI